MWSLAVVLLSLLTYHLISRFLKNKEKKNSRIMSEKKNKTFLRMLRSIIAYALFIMTALVVLQIFGVNVSSMLAGVGIASIVIGFALQDALKDFIRGLEIISDGYYDLGDVIVYNDITGVVTAIGLRTTKIQDLSTMDIVSISNRNIEQAAVVSDQVYLTVPAPYELDYSFTEGVMKEITARLRRTPNITEATYQGITDFATSSLNFQIAITVDPVVQLQTRRAALGVIKEIFDKHNIAIPYSQVEVHFEPLKRSSKAVSAKVAEGKVAERPATLPTKVVNRPRRTTVRAVSTPMSNPASTPAPAPQPKNVGRVLKSPSNRQVM